MTNKKLSGKERYVKTMIELHGCTRLQACRWWEKMQARRKLHGVMWKAHWELASAEQTAALLRRHGKV